MRRDANGFDNADTDYERSDLNVPRLGLIALGVLLLGIAAPVTIAFIYRGALSDVSHARAINPPAPRLQTTAPADLAQFQAKETVRLNGYGWVDRDNGIVHIPINQAMEDIARRGIPDFESARP